MSSGMLIHLLGKSPNKACFLSVFFPIQIGLDAVHSLGDAVLFPTGTPVTTIRVKSLMVPPGIPDWYTRNRFVDAGHIKIHGRAWSGAGVPVAKVELGIDGNWMPADLDQATGKYAWRGWSFNWDAKPGTYVLSCRATDAAGETQPLSPRWDVAGFGNNYVHRIKVTVR